MKKKKLSESVQSLWRFTHQLWPYVRKHRGLLIWSVVAMLAEVGLRLLEPWPLKWIVDRLSEKHFGSATSQFFHRFETLDLMVISAVAVVLFTGLRSFADYINTVGFSTIGGRLLTELRTDVYKHMQTLSLSFHTKAKAGDLIYRLTGDINLLRDIAVTAAVPMMVNLLVLCSMVIVMLCLNWRLALLAFSCLPIFWLLTARFSRRIHENSRKFRTRQGGMAGTAGESIGAIKVVQALSLEAAFSQAFSQQNEKSLSGDLKANKLSARLARIIDLLVAISTALVLWYGSYLVLLRHLTIGELIVFLAYLKKAFKPIQDHARYSVRLSKAAASAERIMELMELTPDIRDLPGAVAAPPFHGEIRFENVSFFYEPEKIVLSNVNFQVQPSQHVALVGPSGIGKSTIANLMLRLYDPKEGRISIDGRDIRDYTLESLRSQISIVLQDSVLFATTVWENIRYGFPDASNEEVETAAKLANAHEFIRLLPHGYETILGERGVTLSNGQRQRIAIARAAIRRCPILILDEPTIGLDEENERTVVEALQRLAEGRTTFLITHDLHLASNMHLILLMEGGSVLEQGSHYELMQVRGRYASLYQLQLNSFNPFNHREDLKQ